MTDTRTLAPALHQAAWPGAPHRRHGLATLRGMIATWRERIRLRRHLGQMAKANPHLIADIGLTRRQVEAEIAKPFWRD